MSDATSTTERGQRDGPQQTYSNLLGITGPVPKWLPISFLAISSAALVVPIVMLRRYKTGLRAAPTSRDIHGHAVSPPPRRRYGTAVLPGSHILGSPTAPPPRVHSRVYPTTPASLPSSPNQGTHPSISLPRQSTEDSFNGPLYTLKALAVATAIVAAGASASVFGVMAST